MLQVMTKRDFFFNIIFPKFYFRNFIQLIKTHLHRTSFTDVYDTLFEKIYD